MKVAIIYDSVTGNTKVIAEAIKKALVQEEVVYCGMPQAVEADLYFVGTWTDKGNASEKIVAFAKTLQDKKIALFGTCGFGQSKEYTDTLASRFQQAFGTSNQFMGSFYCSGKMPPQVRDRYVHLLQEHPEDTKLEISIKNFDEVASHPNEKDQEEASRFALDILERCQK